MGGLLLGLIGVGAIAYVGVCLAIWLGQSRLIFHPQSDLATTPGDIGLTYQDVQIPVGGGHLHGWWLPATDDHTQTILFLHGNAGNIAANLRYAGELCQAGPSILMIDYRGYGLSSGPFPNEARVYEDASAAWRYLTQTQSIAPENIVIFGHSIGGAIAIELARYSSKAAGLIVESTFTSMSAMVDYIGYSRIVPKWLLNQLFDSEQKLPTLHLPMLLIHGLEDNTVPATMSEQLYAKASGPKKLWLVPGANHNDIAEVAGPKYSEFLQRWLASLCPAVEKPI
ncbi:MAG: alpha/beta hydrolase [Leptolyngbyaceae cyanobacterium]